MYRVCKSGLTNDIAPSIHGASYMMWKDEVLYPQHTGPSHIVEEAECPSIHGASYMMWEDEALYPQHTGPSHIGEEEKCLSIHGASYI